MATYKVLQDIESEDKLFGPFTLKQFIFGALTILIGFIGFRVLVMGVPIFIKLPIILTMLPFFLVFGFLAAPLGRDQPNDVWLFAQLRFLFKPRRRIWDQDGIQELVTVTAPKRDNHVYTKGFTQTEVKSRLSALASTLDSRGWAVKNVNANLFAQPGYLSDDQGSDRLLAPTDLPQEVAPVDILASDDILDTANNTTAQNLDRMMQQTTAAIKQQAASKVGQPAGQQASAPSAQDYWFMNQPAQADGQAQQGFATFDSGQVVAPGTNDAIQASEATAEEKELARRLSEESRQADEMKKDRYKVVQPLHDRDGNIVIQEGRERRAEKANETPQTVNPAIQSLAQNDDLNVSTLSREAKRIMTKETKADDGEVVISLH